MPNQFFSPNGDLEKYFITEYWLLDQYIGESLWIWGDNSGGQLGINQAITADRSTPVTTFAGNTNWKQVSCGGNTTAAVKTDGTLWIWGNNSNGQLAINNILNRSTAVTTFAGGTDWKQVSVGSFHTSAVKSDGTLWTWGNNTYGQLANNTTLNRSTPITTFAGGTNWKQVSSGSFYTFAIKTDGTLWSWGIGSVGRLGTNDIINRSTPVTTFAGGTDWKQVSCGGSHVTAIKTDGTLWTWGSNDKGQLGIDDTIDRSTPVTTFSGGTNWKQVSSSFLYSSAIKTDGTLWIWGSNDDGQLGINDTIDRSTPVTTFAGGTNWKQVDTGINLTAAIKTDATLWVWGNNDSGQLGTNDTIDRSTPIQTSAGANGWKQVSANGSQFMAAVQLPVNQTEFGVI